LSKIKSAFENLKRENKRGFIPFITAGDPDLPTTKNLLIELAHAGATIIELGVPFSDPMADGPVIQRASERALKHNFGIGEILYIVRETQKEVEIPIVLFSYFNPLLSYGLERLSREAKMAGVDGVLITDMTPEESEDVSKILKEYELDLIFLVAPTSTDERLKMIAEKATGFIYAVSRTGVTGARDEMTNDAETLVNRVRAFSDLPVAVGFGISTPEQVRDVQSYADAAVVGSAIVKEIEKLNGAVDTVERIGEFARTLLKFNYGNSCIYF
jgi:tryptophan synthase alpha chain